MVLNTTDYISEGFRQLDDVRFYRALDADPTIEHKNIVLEVIRNLKENSKLSIKMCEDLVPNYPQPGRFYMLPKIHKPGNPGRSIIPGIGTLTEPISSYIDSLIRRLPPTFPSFIKDTNHFLREISNLQFQEGAFMVTMDVSSLYTNIPHDEGIAALIETYGDLTEENEPQSDTLGVLARLV